MGLLPAEDPGQLLSLAPLMRSSTQGESGRAGCEFHLVTLGSLN